MHKRSIRHGLLFLLIFILAFSSAATELYRLGPGDQLIITVWERPDLRTDVVVGPDGRIAVPLAGQLHVDGYTLEEVEKALVERLQVYLLDPLVTVQVAKYRTFRVQVLGNVARPGFYNLEYGSTLLDALAAAGGPLQTADLEHIKVGDLEINAANILQNPSLDMELTAGTTISVPAAKPVLVLGAVKNPGTYSLPLSTADATVLDVIALAGGLTLNADENQVRVERYGKETVYEGALKEIGDKMVQPGDTLVVAEKRQVVISGKVLRPGSYQIASGMGVADAIALAGGLLQDASQEVTIYKDSETVVTSVYDRTPLTGGESLVVGTSTNMVLVLGEVVKPGNYAVAQANTLLEAISLAGGPTNFADLRQVTVGERTVDLAKVLRDPSLDVTIGSGTIIFVPKTSPVLVLGAVKNPGTYLPTGEQTLLEIIAQAGGLLDTADDSAISLQRGGEETVGSLTRLGSMVLQNGDVITIPERQQIIVAGQVVRPGAYEVRKGLTVSGALALAGGLQQDAAKTLTVVKDGVSREVPVDSMEVLTGGESLFVGISYQRVLVLGEVARPGSFVWHEGLTVWDVLALAGGQTESSDLQSAFITRNGEILPVDWSKNEPLRGGDILEIPKWNRQVLVMGEVARPGTYTVERNQKLLDVIGLAGGLTEKADYELVVRKDDQFKTINIASALANPADPANVVISGGEVIFVGEARSTVLVFGEVQRPGQYSFKEGDTLSDLIALAGGFTTRADLARIEIRLEDTVEFVPFGEIELTGKETIFVHEVKPVTVLGEVETPGSYAVTTSARLVDVLAKAGGPTAYSDLNNVRIYRDGDPETASTVSAGKGKLIFEGSASENPEVFPGDVIYVNRSKKLNPTEVAAYLSIISSLSSLVRAWLFN